MNESPPPPFLSGRAAELVHELRLAPHPEGGYFREFFRASQTVAPLDGRASRDALTSIDFLLVQGQFSAWHQVCSDEVWHWLEGEPLRLWLMPADLTHLESVELGPTAPHRRPRHVVPAGWWQAAEPLGSYAYTGATVGPGFDFADFSFGRSQAAVREALHRGHPALARLL